ANTSLARFDGLKIQCADQSFLFLGDSNSSHDITPRSLLTSIYRPSIDVTKTKLIGRTNWRRQESVFPFNSRKVANGDADMAGSEQVLPLELDKDDHYFLVVEVMMNLKRKMI
ncbi:Ankyrin repeat domain-containing protein, partial [Trema orientale]